VRIVGWVWSTALLTEQHDPLVRAEDSTHLCVQYCRSDDDLASEWTIRIEGKCQYSSEDNGNFRLPCAIDGRSDPLSVKMTGYLETNQSVMPHAYLILQCVEVTCESIAASLHLGVLGLARSAEQGH